MSQDSAATPEDDPEFDSEVDSEVDPEADSEADSEAEVKRASLRELMVTKRLDELIPYEGNPKDHPDFQISKIASSIKNYGYDQPIVIDDGNEIIKGHGRYIAAKKLGYDEVDVIHREDLTPAQVKGARLADNKTQMESGWDMEALSLEFEYLDDIDFDTEQTGFDAEEVDAIMDEQDFDVDSFFSDEPAEEDDPEAADGGPPPGEFECPECGHHFSPEIEDMGEAEE